MITEADNTKIAEFEKYLVYDEIGDWDGLSEDATAEAVRAYNSFTKEQREAQKKGVKI